MNSAVTERLDSNPIRFAPFWIVLTVSAALWLVLFAIFPPGVQNFPLIDDWAFSRGAAVFAAGGGIHYFHWAAMPQLGQWLWAWPFVKGFGDSYTVFRVSTIVLSWLGLWAFYDLCARRLGSARSAAIAALGLALCPLFFMLSGTFMTDVPSMVFALIAIDFYDRALAGGRYLDLVLATMVAILGITTRHNLVVLPTVALAMWVLHPNRFQRWTYLASLIVPGIAAWYLWTWFKARTDIHSTDIRAEWTNWKYLLIMCYHVLHISGLAALPVWLVDPRPRAPKALVLGLLGMIGMAYWLWAGQGYLWYSGWFPAVDGLITAYGTYSPIQYVGPRPIVLTEPIRIGLTLAGCIGAAGIIDRIADQILRRSVPAGPLLVLAATQLPVVILPYYVYDRYFLPFIPAAIALCAPSQSWSRGYYRLVPIALYGLASLALMHDWLAWNSALWDVGRQAVHSGVKPLEIEGGLEWNGTHWIDAGCPVEPVEAGPFRLERTTSQYFPAVSGEQALAFEPPERSTIRGQRPYSQWLLPGEHQFYWVAAAN
jgi:hypothetical protein